MALIARETRLAHAVLVTHPSVYRKEGDVLHIHHAVAVAAPLRAEEETQIGILHGAGRLEHNGILLPVGRGHLDVFRDKLLVLLQAIFVNQLNTQRLSLAAGDTSPHTEAILCVTLQTDAEEALVLKTGPHIVVAGAGETYVMRILVERAVVLHLYLTESLPTHEVVGREFERAVFQQLAVKTTVGSIVDILKEDTIHRGLNHAAGLSGFNSHNIVLSRKGHRCRKGCTKKDFL